MAEYGLPYWDDRSWPDAWDTLVLGVDTWPGVCEVSGAGVSRKIDVKKAKDQDGATLKDEGYQPARFTITQTIYDEDQWVLLQQLLAKVHPRKKGGPREPLEIFNPQVNFLGITQVYIDKISIPKKPSAGDGLVSVDLSCIEWIPTPKPAPATGGSGGATAWDDSNDAWQAVQDALTNNAADKVAGWAAGVYGSSPDGFGSDDNVADESNFNKSGGTI